MRQVTRIGSISPAGIVPATLLPPLGFISIDSPEIQRPGSPPGKASSQHDSIVAPPTRRCRCHREIGPRRYPRRNPLEPHHRYILSIHRRQRLNRRRPIPVPARFPNSPSRSATDFSGSATHPRQNSPPSRADSPTPSPGHPNTHPPPPPPVSSTRPAHARSPGYPPASDSP